MDLTDLYQEIILDHGKNPRNRREIPGATHLAEGFNPLCGDQIKVWLKVEGGTIADAAFTGQGCAISQASASMMTQAVKGQTVAFAEELFNNFRQHVIENNDNVLDDGQDLGILNCLTGVRRFPNRIKCAVLAWHAMHSALSGDGTVTTE
ncbi:MAG: SUF system NifU family Fe-S cluster assembly protein [Armatimonadetes bacterium]|nr:SUF system NifU family Fe-S cluster assembly protein [Armatimonadota bacterium]